MRMTQLSATRGIMLLAAALLAFPWSASAIEKYSDPAGVNKRIEQLRQSSPSLVKVHKMAVTPGGREMLMIEIGKAGTAVPAVLVTANMTGTTPVATEAALSLASRIASDASLSASHTWYIMPMGNPDAYARYFMKPLWSDPGNATPFNDDTDDQTDEDGYNDLNNDGLITQMRVKAHDGTWVPVEGEPRLMRRADAVQRVRKAFISFTVKASMTTATDSITRILREEPMSISTSPTSLKASGSEAASIPARHPRSEALLKFAFAHPEIAMVLSFGTTNFLLAPPQGGRKGSLDTENIRIPREIGTATGGGCLPDLYYD